MTIVWSGEAVADLKAIFDFIRERNPDAALKVLRSIEETTIKLEKFPEIGPPLGVSHFRQLTVVKYGYVIVYRINGAVIEIANVHHGRTDWLSERE